MPLQGSSTEVNPKGSGQAVSLPARSKFADNWLVPVFRVMGLGALLPFLLSFLAPWLMLAELAVNFQVQWCLGMLGSGAALLLLGRWKSGCMLLCTAGIAASTIIPIYFPESDRPIGKPSERLRIMSFNVLGINDSHSEVMEEIHRYDPDVLIIVEYTLNWEQALAGLKSDYPHLFEHPRWHGFGIAVFSKIPLRDPGIVEEMPFPSDLPVVRATVDFAGKPLEVFGLHLINPIGQEKRKLRARQFAALAGKLNHSPTECVLLGDFNCTNWSHEFRSFLKATGLRDSRQGFGIFPSWSPQGIDLLSIPIDHALVSQKLAVLSRTTGEKAGSDHRPVIIDLSWKTERRPESR